MMTTIEEIQGRVDMYDTYGVHGSLIEYNYLEDCTFLLAEIKRRDKRIKELELKLSASRAVHSGEIG